MYSYFLEHRDEYCNPIEVVIVRCAAKIVNKRAENPQTILMGFRLCFNFNLNLTFKIIFSCKLIKGIQLEILTAIKILYIPSFIEFFLSKAEII